MEYNFTEIEKKWQRYWSENGTFKVDHHSEKPKFYVLDMFPYPSGSGLHVGHPLGYIASDIYARYKRLKGFNVLHPMGYDAFGLPAEQYALQTGQHPAVTTENNIARYREQLDKIGFSYDWDREVRTSSPDFYKWTQWIFIQLYNSWYNNDSKKAESIDALVQVFEKQGNAGVNASCSETPEFDAAAWAAMDEKEQQATLLNYRLAYLSETMVNWCPGLGTVLANEEVKDGLSERGDYPVERKLMQQWSLRITAYAQRLLDGLETIDWSDSLKEIQRNWIGRSQGAYVRFKVAESDIELPVFTTRPDTIFGVTFMVIAPEHELVDTLTIPEQKAEVEVYVTTAKGRSERDRMADVKKVTGVFTGSYVTHPFTGDKIPVWIGDYVLMGYGTGAVMSVPSGDQRDWDFASNFGLAIPAVIEGTDVSEGANEDKGGVLMNSDFLNGMKVKQAISAMITRMVEMGIGERQVNYKLRDAIFSRQRYWGEPFPVYYKNDIPHMITNADLPVILPDVDQYKPTETGEPPLARADNWKPADGERYEYNTMPGWAGSSWYYLRYMDPHNEDAFVSKEALEYWGNVDLYMGGAEHATGHLLYIRFWTKFLHDKGYLPFDEPAQKLINQGMIQAEDGQKMSKRLGNVVNPDEVVERYGADSLRLHEMFLGPIEQSKPWNTKGIDGVVKFLKKFWRLYHDAEGNFDVSDDAAGKEELKALHELIRKVEDDNERFSFNTLVSAFMVCVNKLTDLKCNKREILAQLPILICPHAPHICEELWSLLGNDSSITYATFPTFNAAYLVEDTIQYPVSFNGKMRFKIELGAELSKEEVEAAVMSDERSAQWLEGNAPKRVIVVPKRIVNIVV